MQQNHRPWPKHGYKHSAHVSCTNRTTDPGHSTGTNIQPMCLVPTEPQTLATARVQTFSPCVLYQQNHRPWPKHGYKHSAHVSCTNRTTDPGQSTGTNIQPMCLVPTEPQTLATARVQTFSPCVLYQQNHRPWPKHGYKHSAHVSCTNRSTDPGQSTGTNIQPMCLVPTEAQTLAKARVQTFSPCLLYAATLNCLLTINPAMKIKHWRFMPHHFAVHATMQNQLSLLLSSTFSTGWGWE